MPRTGVHDTKRSTDPGGSWPNKREGKSLQEKFEEFGEVSSEFVREIGIIHDFSYAGNKSRSVADNVNVTKKVFSKWSIEILVSVYSLKSVGFGDLKKLLSGISSRVLSQKLKDLQALGLLERQVSDVGPPCVRYRLSRKGVTLAKLGEPVILYMRNEQIQGDAGTG